MNHASRAPWILGLSASHNGAACLLRGDEIVVAVQEERLSRLKRHRIFGAQRSRAIEYCLEYAGIEPSDLDMVVSSVQGRANNPIQDLTLNPSLHIARNDTPVRTIPHHLAHALSAYATSGFDDAAVLVVDGWGSPYEDLTEEEKATIVGSLHGGWEIISLYSARGVDVQPLEKHMSEHGVVTEVRYDRMPQFESLGGLFSSVATQIFGNILDAGKVMGLAPYGKPVIPRGEFFDIVDGEFIFHDHIPGKYDHAERWPARRDEYHDLSASVQVALEEAIFHLLGRLKELYPSKNFCYAGGVALNSVANERILRESGYEGVYIVPAAEDSGCAIGAAYHGLWQLTGANNRWRLRHDAVGRDYSSADISAVIEQAPDVETVESDDVVADAVDLLMDGKIVGWFQGRSELGPRALGQRSILCDPRREDGKAVINERVKHREAFRPFAPVILKEATADWFDLGETPPDSPFMLRVCPFREGKGEKVPAVTHVDGTGRLQTVTRENNGRYYDLVKTFGEKTGVPILLNTSFNVMGEPIVETPQDALWCLLRTGIDFCVLEDTLVTARKKYAAQEVSSFLRRIERLKTSLSAPAASASPAAEAMQKNRLAERIHQATTEAVPEIRREIEKSLGRSPTDLSHSNLEQFWAERLFSRTWANLGEESQALLRNAGFLHSIFSKHHERDLIDWAPIKVEMIKVVTRELNRKLIAPFAEWLRDGRMERVKVLLAEANRSARRNDWWLFLRRLESGGEASDSAHLTLPPIHQAFRDLELKGSTASPEGFDSSELLGGFVESFEDDAAQEFFRELPVHLRTVVTAREEALQADKDRSGREGVEAFFPTLQWLLSRLDAIYHMTPQVRVADPVG